ncbi:MAG: lipid A export permease/ATP-binding protein MsbA [Gammaproteobacteria bacterium]|nr:lipid A export permease/ATP-binding protein MsbA [Gammaproteobacteria bacterium]
MKPTPAAEIYRRLLRALRPHRAIFLSSLLGMVALAATEWILPALLRYLVDEEFGNTARQYSLLIPVALVALFLARGVMSYVANVGLSWVAHRVVMDLRGAMFRNLIALPTRFFDQKSAGQVLSKFTFDVTQVAQAATHCLTVLVKDSVVITALLGYMVFINWRLALFLVVLAPPIGWVINRVSARMRDMSKRLQSSMGDINVVMEETLGGHRDIKIFGGQEYETSRFDRAIKAARQFQMKVIGTNAAMEPVIQALIALGVGLMMVLALREATHGEMTRGDFISFVAATALLLAPIKRLTSMNEYLQRGLAAAESIFALIDEPPEANSGNRQLSKVRGTLEFRQVSAAYGEKPVLNDIDFRIEAGESVALVGPSGSGKTTLVNLIPRFYEPSRGTVSLDDIPLNDCELRGLRRQIAYVGQQVVLFNDTIFNNIAYGSLRNEPRDHVLAAAEAAFVTEFVAALPEGFNTLIGDNGVRLSGGQRQRLAIARAILKNAPILILDEATSALDAESERRIQQALGVLRKGRTCLIIAHRLSTIEGVDRVVVLEDGRIIEHGRHEELLQERGLYAKLYALQRAAPDDVVPVSASANASGSC